MSGSPAWRSGTGRRNPSSTWLWNRQGLSAEAPQDWGKQILLLDGSHKLSLWDPGQSNDTIEAWARPTCESLRVYCRGSSQLWFTVEARALVADAPGNTPLHEFSWRLPFWHRDLVPPNSLQAPMLGHLRPNHQQGWNTAPPISRQAAWSHPEPTAANKHTS